MQEINRDDLIASMSILWQKLADVCTTLEARLKTANKNTELVLSRAWLTLDVLKKEGLAEYEYDGPLVRCKLTKAGSQRKAQLTPAAQLAGA